MIDLDVAELIAKVFLPTNERKMRKADPSVVAAVTAFKAAVRTRRSDEATRPRLTDDECLRVEKNEIIGAIKSVRARLGLGLREAKDLVDQYRSVR